MSLFMADSSLLPPWITVNGFDVEWAPTGASTPGPYEVVVLIQDNGSPVLMDSCAFTLTYVTDN